MRNWNSFSFTFHRNHHHYEDLMKIDKTRHIRRYVCLRYCEWLIMTKEIVCVFRFPLRCVDFFKYTTESSHILHTNPNIIIIIINIIVEMTQKPQRKSSKIKRKRHSHTPQEELLISAECLYVSNVLLLMKFANIGAKWEI